jgi:hypothetical protein
MRYEEAQIVGHVLVLFEGDDQDTTAVGGVPMGRIAAWRTDYNTSHTTLQVDGAYQIAIDHNWRNDHGETLVDLDEALRAYFKATP